MSHRSSLVSDCHCIICSHDAVILMRNSCLVYLDVVGIYSRLDLGWGTHFGAVTTILVREGVGVQAHATIYWFVGAWGNTSILRYIRGLDLLLRDHFRILVLIVVWDGTVKHGFVDVRWVIVSNWVLVLLRPFLIRIGRRSLTTVISVCVGIHSGPNLHWQTWGIDALAVNRGVELRSDSWNLFRQFPARNSLPDRINVHFVNRFFVRTFPGHLFFANRY